MTGTNKCSICGTEMNKGVCPLCGGREIDDFVRYRTLSAPDARDVEQRARLKTAAESAQRIKAEEERRAKEEKARREKAERERREKADAKTKENRDGEKTVKTEDAPKKYRFTNEEAVKAAAKERELREQLYGNGVPKYSDSEYRFAYKKAEQKAEPAKPQDSEYRHAYKKAEPAKPQDSEYRHAYKKAEPAKPQDTEYRYAYKKAEPAKPQDTEYHHAYKKAEPVKPKTEKKPDAASENKKPADVKPTKTTVKTEPHKTETASKAEKPFENDKTKKSKLKILMTIRKVAIILSFAIAVLMVYGLGMLVDAGKIDFATYGTMSNIFGGLGFCALLIVVITTICIWIGKKKNKR